MRTVSTGGPEPFPELRGKLQYIRYPCMAEVKLDGEANKYYCGHLWNKSGKARDMCPITETLKALDIHVFGELYYGEGKSGDLYKFLSHAKSDDLKFAIYDILRVGDNLVKNKPLLDRKEILFDIFSKVISSHVSLIGLRWIESREELDTYYAEVIKAGYEGIVVKNTHEPFTELGACNWVKMKYQDTLDLKVTQVSQTQERVEVDFNGVKVGVKVKEKYKRYLHPGCIIEVKHYGILSGGSLRHPSYVRHRIDKEITNAAADGVHSTERPIHCGITNKGGSNATKGN